MACVSVLMPAWKFPSSDKLITFMNENFGQVQENVEYYEMVPIHKEKITSSTNLAVKFKSSEFNMVNIENLIKENKHLQTQLERTKETVQNLSQEYNKMFTNSAMLKEAEEQKALKRAQKTKQLDDDNKKLKQLLRSQLENSEKLRTETQATIEILKEEFELLVKELAHLQKKNPDVGHGFVPIHEQKYNNFIGTTVRTSDIIPKIDKIENIFNNQQNFSVRVEDDVLKN